MLQHADDIDWYTYLRGDPVPGIHWHGFYWKGPAGRIYLARHQAERQAGTPEFATSTTPPEMLWQHLLKPRLVRETWTDPAQAAQWMRDHWDADPPTETHKNPDSSQHFHQRMAQIGKDTVWSWDYPRLGDNTTVRLYVITCPNQFSPRTPCPAPPRA